MSFLDKVWTAGIVGCGGAGFPAHVKWNTQSAKILIINAVECEPLLCTDRYLMRHFASDIVLGCTLVAQQLGVVETVIAIKEEYRAEIDALKAALVGSTANIRLKMLKAFYPAGDEQVIVHEVTGRTVPCGGLPLDVGAVVSNVGTVLAAANAERDIPMTEKYITVAGAVKHPCIVRAPVGTSAAECISAAGGTLDVNPILVAGGPMMGKLLSDEPADNQVVTKTTSGLLVFPSDSYMGVYKKTMDIDQLRKRAAVSCIQCSYCSMLCPRHMLGHPLEPHRIMRTLAHCGGLTELLSSNDVLQSAAWCSTCGACAAYACPMGLQPSKVNALLKEEMAKQGIRPQKRRGTEPDTNRDLRKIPTERLLSRLDIHQYEEKVIDTLITVSPHRVTLLLRQGAGRSPIPVVAKGDRVQAGQIVAEIPADVMGANLHTGIDGVVTSVTDRIIIEKE